MASPFGDGGELLVIPILLFPARNATSVAPSKVRNSILQLRNRSIQGFIDVERS